MKITLAVRPPRSRGKARARLLARSIHRFGGDSHALGALLPPAALMSAVLIKAGKQTVGAIGVGGSTGATQDEKCAYAGIEKIKRWLE